MNILFLTLLDFNSINESGIYTDLMKVFINDNHNVYIVSPIEKRFNKNTHLLNYDDCKILKLQIGNIQKTKHIEKGVSLITLESKFIKGIKKYFSKIKFDLVLFSTPPITLHRSVEYVKRRDNAKTYLLLKDIFPQNAIDLGMFSSHSLVARYFKFKEKKLYLISDYIGCMSQKNVDYVLNNNISVDKSKIEVCPNSIEPLEHKLTKELRLSIMKKYKIPEDKVLFIYGGNLGKPQGVDFLIECIRATKTNKNAFFIIVGSGIEYSKIDNFFGDESPQNSILHKSLPKEDYEALVNICDVGLIYLDKRFTIPNFPSRLLSYLQAGIPVLSSTDTSTDIGSISTHGGFGLWNESGDIETFCNNVELLCCESVRVEMGLRARRYLENNYTSKHSFDIIMKHFGDKGEVNV